MVTGFLSYMKDSEKLLQQQIFFVANSCFLWLIITNKTVANFF